MAQFLSLNDLRERIWPLALAKGLATDMTGVSLPILHFPGNDLHPHQVLFLLYYAVPDAANPHAPEKITRPYAWVSLDMQSGELVEVSVVRRGKDSNPLVGPGVPAEVFELPDDKRRMLQELFFSRLDEAAQMYASGHVSVEQMDHLADLLGFFETLSEPPLREDYEQYGKPFFDWLRQHATSDIES